MLCIDPKKLELISHVLAYRLQDPLGFVPFCYFKQVPEGRFLLTAIPMVRSTSDRIVMASGSPLVSVYRTLSDSRAVRYRIHSDLLSADDVSGIISDIISTMNLDLGIVMV